MKIGIPLEIKPFERRVALLPAATAELIAKGHEVFLQTGAGVGSGYDDLSYTVAGGKVVKDAESLYGEAEMIVKVKEPIAADLAFLREDHLVFSYLHLAANPNLTRSLQSIGLTALAFETLLVDNNLPLLAPMSDVEAAKLAGHTMHLLGCECEALPSRHRLAEEAIPGRVGQVRGGGEPIR